MNLRNDLFAFRKLLGCAQLVKLALGSIVDDKIRFMRGIEFLLVLFLADHAILLDNGIGVAVIVHRFQHGLFARHLGSGSVIAAAGFPRFRTGSIHGGVQLVRGQKIMLLHAHEGFRSCLETVHRRPAVIADALALGAFCFAVNHAPNGKEVLG